MITRQTKLEDKKQRSIKKVSQKFGLINELQRGFFDESCYIRKFIHNGEGYNISKRKLMCLFHVFYLEVYQLRRISQ
jgi:hypothetical protein